MVQSCRSSFLCPDCHVISYCSRECLAEDRSDHRLECHVMEELEDLPDITRMMARLLLKVEEGGEEQSEPLPFSMGDRTFASLLSHEDKIDEEDKCAAQIFDSLSQIIPAATGTWQHFKHIYGKLIINSFEISGEYDDDKLGWALYLAPSILDHSCVPSAEVTFSGKNIQVISRVTMRPKDLSKNSISFIDRTKSFSQRAETLLQRFDLVCECSLCREVTHMGGRMRSLLRGQTVITCLMSAVEEQATGKQRHYLASVR